MASVGTQGDGLRFKLAGVEIPMLRFSVSPPGLAGVTVLAAAGRNGGTASSPGAGIISSMFGGLTWQAPGSSIAGVAVQILGDGEYLLLDGEDPSKWLRVGVLADYLPSSGSAQVNLTDSYNALGPSDLTAAQAAAGNVETTQYTLANVTNNTITNLLLWLDASASGEPSLTVSSDGVTFYAPTSSTDPHVLSWATIASGASATLWVKRTISSGAASNPQILNLLQYQWNAPN